MWKWNMDFWICEVTHFHELVLFIIGVNNLEGQYNKIAIPNEENVVIYYKIRQQLAKLGKEIEEYVHKPKYCLPFLQPGRLVKVIWFFFCFVFISNLPLCETCRVHFCLPVYHLEKLHGLREATIMTFVMFLLNVQQRIQRNTVFMMNSNTWMLL